MDISSMQPSSETLAAALSSFNAVDWILFAILAWSVVTAFLRGLIRELFALAGLFLGILLAGLYYLPLSSPLGVIIANPVLRQAAAFLAIALAAMILAGLLGRLVRRTASLVGLGFFDRLAGALFGFARGCLVGIAVITAFSAFPGSQTALKHSRLSPYFLAGAHGVSFVVPQPLQQQITDGISGIRH